MALSRQHHQNVKPLHNHHSSKFYFSHHDKLQICLKNLSLVVD